MPTTTIPITDKCTQLVITPGVPITSIDGRTNGNQISFINYTYADYAMRRKAEVLQYRSKDTLNKKNVYSYVSTKGYYSQAQLKRFLENQTVECNVSSSSSASGVIGSYSTYYLNMSVPFYSSI